MFLFFTSDHVNYSGWVSVYRRDMQASPLKWKDMFNKCWVVHLTFKRITAILIDQAHGQENATVQGRGEVVGLTENSDALLRWMTSGPELARLVTQSEFVSLERFTTTCSKSIVPDCGLGHML